MVSQTTLPFPSAPQKETLKQKALRWLREHPDARKLFRRYAEEMVTYSLRGGINGLVERARWQHGIEHGDKPDHVFQINNSYAPYISRWLIAKDPRLASLIRCRRTRAGNKPARNPRASPDVDPFDEEDDE